MQHGTMLGMHEPGVVGVRRGVKRTTVWCTYIGLFEMFGWKVEKVEFEIPPERLPRFCFASSFFLVLIDLSLLAKL